MGYMKANLQDHKGAIADFAREIEFTPNDAKSYYSKGVSRLSLGQKHIRCLDISNAGELGFEKA